MTTTNRCQSEQRPTRPNSFSPDSAPRQAYIQPHGILLLFDRHTGRLVHRAGDCERIFGLKALESTDANALLGIAIDDLVECCLLSSSGASVYIGEMQPQDRQSLAMLVHETGSFVAVELMPAHDKMSSAHALGITGIISKGINSSENIGEACGIAVEHLRSITGFDSVRVFQFLGGESVSVAAGPSAFEALVYVGSQNRATSPTRQPCNFHQGNLVHVIPDLASQPVAIEPVPSSSLDTSRFILRTATQDYVNELRDLGFGASVSIAIFLEGELWGLIACLHPEPRSIPIDAQLLCRHVGVTLSEYVLAFHKAETIRIGSIQTVALDSILEDIHISDDPERRLRTSGDELMQLIQCGGFVLLENGELIAGAGRFPEVVKLRKLSVFMEAKLQDRNSYSIERLGDEFADAPAMTASASGILGIRLEAWRPLIALWLRPAQLDEIEWSHESVSGRSHPWTSRDVEIAELFRVWVGYAMQRHHLIKLNAELADANALLSMQATTDPLTELPNRRLFNQRLESEWERARREKRTLALVAIDIDHFKEYNDCLGHPAGDECLKKVAHAISSSCRTIDVAARLGGDEFALILPGLDVSAATLVAERVRGAVQDLRIEHPHHAAGIVTISLGVAAGSPAEGSKASEVLSAMDTALYRAKAGGRNTISEEAEKDN